MTRPIATRSATGIPTGRLAVWWVLASEVVIFGGLLGSYIMHRLGHPEWADDAAHTNIWIGAFNTLVLLIVELHGRAGAPGGREGGRQARPPSCSASRSSAR